ncbi:MAG: hypothetical protein ACHQEB_04795, partial [Chitinophagales bacterium]
MLFHKRLLIAATLFISIISHGQILPCLDVTSASRREAGAGQGVYDFNNKWTPGTVLTVSFMDGTEWQHD